MPHKLMYWLAGVLGLLLLAGCAGAATPVPTPASVPPLGSGNAATQSPPVPRQLFLPVPVASLKNVTEISALGTTFNQRQFPQQMFVPRSFTGNGVDQFTRHDAPPLLHPPLQSAPVGPVKPVRIS